VAAVSVPPVIPKPVPRSGPVRRTRGPLPIQGLVAPPSDAAALYAMSAVDKSGRLADRSIARVLGWRPRTRLDIREHDGLITIRPAADGVHYVDDRGHLRLPLAARRWCRVATGDRLLLAADPATDVLVAYPLPMLDRLLVHARAATAGDAA
jgi:hypothetical protein